MIRHDQPDQHPHAHPHARGHAHGHDDRAPGRPDAAPAGLPAWPASLLMQAALPRLVAASAVIALLWLAVAWALGGAA